MSDKSLDGTSQALDDTIYDHKWGFADTRFAVLPDGVVTVTGSRYAISGTEMPGFLPFVEEMLGVKLDTSKIKPEIAPKPVQTPHLNSGFCEALSNSFASRQFTTDDRTRLIHSHGQTTADEVYKVLYGSLERTADLVFYLEQENDAVVLIQLALEHDICLVPYGGGTSVSCALKLPTRAQEPRMIVVVDTRRLNQIEWIDEENFLASVQAGITGKDLEEQLNAKGFTSGHEPDSMELSTLGGWIATNASGMKKNRYGNIEDIVENVTMVTPRGVIEQAQTMPRLSIGMQLQKLLFGCEGNLGFITKAVIRIHKLPETKKYGSIVFPTFKQGTDYLYALTQTGVLPASIRLLDNVQFRFGSALKPRPTASEKVVGDLQKFVLLKLKGLDPNEICAATIVMEGTKEEVAYQSSVIFDLCKKFDGISGGAGNGRRGYMLTYAIAYIRDFLADFDTIGETYETTVPWSQVDAVISAVDRVAHEQHARYNLPGRPYVSPRVTQLYHTGVCIYFTHGFSTQGVDAPDKVFAAMEHELRQTIVDHGGSISHHHGVGKLRNDFMSQTISPTSIDMLKEIKQAHDSKNIFGIRNNVFAD